MKCIAAFAVLAFALPSFAGDDVFPAPVPRVDLHWSIEVSGEGTQVAPVRLANARLEYALYAEAEGLPLYRITYYRVSPKKRTGMFAPAVDVPRYRPRDVIAWFDATEGNRLRFLVRTRSGAVTWHELVPQTPEWTRERGIVLRIMSVHALMRSHGQSAASLTF